MDYVLENVNMIFQCKTRVWLTWAVPDNEATLLKSTPAILNRSNKMSRAFTHIKTGAVTVRPSLCTVVPAVVLQHTMFP
jgi:hypothetical protein